MRIFVAGKYSAPTPQEVHENVAEAMVVATELLRAGHQPFLPHLSHHWDWWMRDHGLTSSYERWMQWSLSWLEACDALYYLGPSPGADREKARAEELGLPIYTRLEDVPLGRCATMTAPRVTSSRAIGQVGDFPRCSRCGACILIPIGKMWCRTKTSRRGYWWAGYAWADYPYGDGGWPLFWLRRRTRKMR